jgi:hypothetical protein
MHERRRVHALSQRQCVCGRGDVVEEASTAEDREACRQHDGDHHSHGDGKRHGALADLREQLAHVEVAFVHQRLRHGDDVTPTERRQRGTVAVLVVAINAVAP